MNMSTTRSSGKSESITKEMMDSVVRAERKMEIKKFCVSVLTCIFWAIVCVGLVGFVKMMVEMMVGY